MSKQETQDKIKLLEAKVEQLTQELQAKDKQLEETQELFKQREKLAFLGKTTAVVFHDLGNCLFSVKADYNAALKRCYHLEKSFREAKFWLGEETIEEFFTDNPDKDAIVPNLKSDILCIKEQFERISKIYYSACNYINSEEDEGRGVSHQEVTFTEANPNNIVAESLDLACRYGEFKKLKIGKDTIKLNLETDYDSAIKNYSLPVEEIRRILLNIIDNAYYAVYEKKEEDKDYIPTISIKTELIDEAIKIIIKDNGKGIPRKIDGRRYFDILDPFLTSKPDGEGTGLGLYIVALLLDKIQLAVKPELQKKVDMRIKTKRPEFTQFTLFFPIS